MEKNKRITVILQEQLLINRFLFKRDFDNITTLIDNHLRYNINFFFRFY